LNYQRIIIGSDRRPETKQGIEGRIVKFRPERVRDRVMVKGRDRRSEPDQFWRLLNSLRRSEPNTVHY